MESRKENESYELGVEWGGGGGTDKSLLAPNAVAAPTIDEAACRHQR